MFLDERLKLLMLANQLLDSYDGIWLYNDTVHIDIEANGNDDSYLSIDDEDGVSFTQNDRFYFAKNMVFQCKIILQSVET